MTDPQDEPLREHASSSVLRKVVITAVSGGVAYGVTTVANQEPTLSVTLSILIGGVALVIQFLADFENRLSQLEISQATHARRVEHRVQATFLKVNEATELFSLLEQSALKADVVTQLVRHSAEIKPSAPRLVRDLAHSELGRMSVFLKELSNGGEVTYDGEDRDWLLALARCAEQTIDAVSMTAIDADDSSLGGLWTSDLGRRYLGAQGEAAQREINPVKIRRLIVLERGLAADSIEVVRLCRKHTEVGIEVKILEPAHAPATIQTALFDFVVFDRVISYEVSTPPLRSDDGPTNIMNTRLVLHGSRVDNRVRDFERLWAAGQEVSTAHGATPSLPRPRGAAGADSSNYRDDHGTSR